MWPKMSLHYRWQNGCLSLSQQWFKKHHTLCTLSVSLSEVMKRCLWPYVSLSGPACVPGGASGGPSACWWHRLGRTIWLSRRLSSWHVLPGSHLAISVLATDWFVYLMEREELISKAPKCKGAVNKEGKTEKRFLISLIADIFNLVWKHASPNLKLSCHLVFFLPILSHLIYTWHTTDCFW